jgi:hypothetical protein
MMRHEPKPLAEHRRIVKSQLNEAEWTGDEQKAEMLRAELRRIELALAEGETWHVPF